MSPRHYTLNTLFKALTVIENEGAMIAKNIKQTASSGVKKKTKTMKAIPLENSEQLENIKTAEGNSIIFKHNTSCPISRNCRADFEEKADLLPDGTAVYFLDLLNYREISDSIADKFNIKHESPQLLVIKNGRCFFHQSHYDISAEDAAKAIRSN